MSLTVAVWIIAITLLLGVAGTFIFLLGFQRDITRTLTEVEMTLKTVEKNIDMLSEELHKTLKNTTGITEETKNLIKNVNTITSLNAIFQPLTQIGGQKDFVSKIISIGKIAMGIVQGYNLYKNFIGGKNERRES
ncbi:MAG: DUF948 domain-containing protein [Caldisericum sp.]|jgi:uncharacterized protein YoxC|nr:DUF948 domain-containing protein [Caldisericum sp.]